jgi:hypothetical protein
MRFESELGTMGSNTLADDVAFLALVFLCTLECSLGVGHGVVLHIGQVEKGRPFRLMLISGRSATAISKSPDEQEKDKVRL